MARLALPFIADETPGDHSPGRLALAVALGAVVGLGAALLGGLAAITIYSLGAHLLGADQGPPTPPINEILSNPALAMGSVRASVELIFMVAAINGAGMFAFVAAAAFVLKRRFSTYLAVASRFRWGLVLTGLALHLLLIGPLLIWESWDEISGGRFPLATMTDLLGARVFYVAVALVTVFLAALAEEVLFRGWLLRHMTAVLRNPWIALAAGSLLFSAAHMEFTPGAFIVRALMGAGFCWMTLRTGGVELAAGVHLANNLLLTLFVQPLTLAAPPETAISAQDMIEIVSVAVGYLAIAEIAVRLFKTTPRNGGDMDGAVIA